MQIKSSILMGCILIAGGERNPAYTPSIRQVLTSPDGLTLAERAQQAPIGRIVNLVVVPPVISHQQVAPRVDRHAQRFVQDS